jgi:hypothetical protein
MFIDLEWEKHQCSNVAERAQQRKKVYNQRDLMKPGI